VRRRPLVLVPLVVVLGIAATVGVFLLRGGNEPPPPALSAAPPAAPAAAADGEGAGAGDGTYAVAGGSFVGYRVRETFASSTCMVRDEGRLEYRLLLAQR